MKRERVLSIPLRQLLQQLETSSEGLSEAEASDRLASRGPNEVPSGRPGETAASVLSRLWGPIPWLMEAAALFAALARDWTALALIAGLLVANALVALWERREAARTMRTLRSTLTLSARVRRDGSWRTVRSRELVPGDVIRLRLGDVVPADARLLEGDPVSVDQLALTGEALPLTVESGGTVYAGSLVRQGDVDAVVFATGADCRYGRAARLIHETAARSVLQRAILRGGDVLVASAFMSVIVILAVSLFRGERLLSVGELALVLGFAAIPVALPAVLASTMAAGARRLAGAHAVVTQLAGIEALAGIDVLCCDKNGAITEDHVSVGEPFSVGGASADEVLEAAALASCGEDKDPIDDAVLARSGLSRRAKEVRVVHFVPFDPVHNRTEATIGPSGGPVIRVSRGAPQAVLDLADNREAVRPEVERAVRRFATRGRRALGVARAGEDGRWRFLGVLPLYDPPREGAREAVAAARAMGVDFKMVTGDQQVIAGEIARNLDLSGAVLDASVFSGNGSSKGAGNGSAGRPGNGGEEALPRAVERADTLAQVAPEQKRRIVEALQRRGHLVAITGEGVGDVSGLRQADVGIALPGAVDAARSAAQVVMTSPGLSAVTAAVQEARRVLHRMRTYAIYRIAAAIHLLLFATISVLAFDFFPLTAAMIVLLVLLGDGALLKSLVSDAAPFAQRPRPGTDAATVFVVSTVLGLMGVAASLVLFYLAESLYGLGRSAIQTLLFLQLSVSGHLAVLAARTEGPFWRSRPSRLLLLSVAGAQLIATLIAVYGVLMAPVGWAWAIAVWVYATAWLVASDLVKRQACRTLRYGLLGGARHDNSE